jgi:hypothetical protein
MTYSFLQQHNKIFLPHFFHRTAAKTMNRYKPTFQPRVTRLYSRWLQEPQVQHSILRLQHWWDYLQNKQRLQPKNTVDYITLEPPEPPVFLHVNEAGIVTAFSADTLANYFEASGEFKHPETRVPFNLVEIRRLDQMTERKYNLTQNLDSIVTRHQDERVETQLVDFLQNDLETCYQNILAACRSENLSNDQWENEMVFLLPLFNTAFYAFCILEPDVALQKLRAYMSELSGTYEDGVSTIPLETTSLVNIFVRQLMVQRYISVQLFTYLTPMPFE